MFARLRRLIRSFFGNWLDKMEDPVLILQQNIRDLNDLVPRMNQGIASVKAHVTLLESERHKLQDKSVALQARIKAALKAGRRDMALNYATTLEEVRESLKVNERQWELAKASLEHALKVKQAFMKEKEKKTREAIRAIREAERAKWQREIASAMETFEVTGIDQTHEEMVSRVEEKAAVDRAHLELALHSVDDAGIQMEEEVKRLEANEIVRQFEHELGIDDSEEPPPQPAAPITE